MLQVVEAQRTEWVCWVSEPEANIEISNRRRTQEAEHASRRHRDRLLDLLDA